VQQDLFEDQGRLEPLDDGLVRLRGRVQGARLREQIAHVVQQAPWRHMTLPGGGRMAVAMSNCGAMGWVADHKGYRYSSVDPASRKPWPPMPADWQALAQSAAAESGFGRFEPDACLINRYAPGAGLGVHRDYDEADLGHPIVSVSIGASAVFLWGGLLRRDPLRRIALHDGDVLVWGRSARLTYHGVMPLARADPQALRFNLTFRRAT
jgi:alkylated DNA repair protein (DNA oxidative demethylase)